MICENCGSEHDENYGSGRFCSSKCAKGYSTKAKRKEINEKVSKKLKINLDKECLKCKKIFSLKKKTQLFCSISCSTSYNNLKNSKLRSEIAKKINFGGNRNSYAHGWYESKIAGKVYLESSYEYKVAKELDKNNIIWERPNFLKWDNKRYFPDFYLKEFNIYLDPKNDYLISKDFEKIKKVEEQNNVTILILNKNELDWDSIKLKIQHHK
jgi:hypothetical protein